MSVENKCVYVTVVTLRAHPCDKTSNNDHVHACADASVIRREHASCVRYSLVSCSFERMSRPGKTKCLFLALLLLLCDVQKAILVIAAEQDKQSAKVYTSRDTVH